MKQTAVELFIERLTELGVDLLHFKPEIIEAKQLEKQQIVDAVDGHPIQNRNLDGEQYYIETYGK